MSLIQGLWAVEEFYDRDEEQARFRELLEFRGDARLLTIADASGKGKSALLEKLERDCRDELGVAAARIALDQLTNPSPLYLIQQLGEPLGKPPFGISFPGFEQYNGARLVGDFRPFAPAGATMVGTVDAREADIQGGTLTGVVGAQFTAPVNQVVIDASPQRLSAEQQVMASQRCIKEFFNDLTRICATQAVVLLFDAFEACDRRLQTWLVDELVHRCCFDRQGRPERLVVVLAGQRLPPFRRQRDHRLVVPIDALGQWDEDQVREFLVYRGYQDVLDEEVALVSRMLREGRSLLYALSLMKAVREVRAQ